MHVIENKRIYYLVDRRKGKTFELGDYSDLISFMANQCRKITAYSNEVVNPYENFDFSGTDKSLQPVERYGWKKVWIVVDGMPTHVEKFGIIRDFEYLAKPYMVVDDTGSIVNVRLFDEDIKAEFKRRGTKPHFGTTKDAVYGEVRYFRHWLMWQRADHMAAYRFRKGPVPCIHNYKGRSYTSKSHRAQLWKNKDVMRPKTRIDRADLWDGHYRHTDRSWKSSCKVRHQWQKHEK